MLNTYLFSFRKMGVGVGEICQIHHERILCTIHSGFHMLQNIGVHEFNVLL